jgi:CheY-specific phosphatase CheX
MTICVNTESLILEAIDGAAREVFQLMAGVELQPSNPTCLVDKVGPSEESTQLQLSVMLGLSGDLQGSFGLSMDESTARRWTERLLGIEVSELDQNVIDAIGEMGNLVVGSMKRRLSQFVLTMSLPNVITAGLDRMRFASSVVPIKLRYEFDGHPLSIIVLLSKSL